MGWDGGGVGWDGSDLPSFPPSPFPLALTSVLTHTLCPSLPPTPALPTHSALPSPPDARLTHTLCPPLTSVLTHTLPTVVLELVAGVTRALEGPGRVHTLVLAGRLLRGTLVNF